MAISYTPDQQAYKEMTPFRRFVLQSFPWIDSNFDALTNYELMGKIIEYLNDIISNENAVQSNVTALYNAFVSLQSYVNNYFDNLDVQDEINAKLDSMAQDGSLTTLIGEYVTPYIDAQNTRIANVENELSSVASGSPAGVYATTTALASADPDHSKIYLVTADGKWYYHNGTTWTAGGTYQSTGVSDFSIDYSKILDIPNSTILVNWIDGGICSQNNSLGEGFITTSTDYKRSEPIPLKKGMILSYDCNVDNTMNILSKVDSSNAFISTLKIGNDRGTYRYIATDETEYVCITIKAASASASYISVYDPNYKFVKTENKKTIPFSIGGYVASINNTFANPGNVVNNQPATSTALNNRYLRTDFIKLKQGNILKIKAQTPATVNVISVFNTQMQYVSGIVGKANAKFNDYNYVAENDCYVIVSNDITLIPNSSIYFYENYDEYENDEITWNNFFVLNNTITFTSGSTNYMNTNEILLRKGDVLDFYTGTTTDNAYKLSIWKNGVNTSGIIQNNTNSQSQYYQKSLRTGYVATEDCFVRVMNKFDYVSSNDIEIAIYKFKDVENANIYNKIISVIGDSYVANQSQNIGLTWHSRIASKYGSKYNNYGINGNGLVTPDGTGIPVVDRTDDIASNSDIVIVVGGKNDYNQQISINDFKTGLKTICSDLIDRFYDKKIIFFTPWNSYGQNDSANIKLVEYVDAIKECCGEYSIPVYDSFHDSNMYMWLSDFHTDFTQGANDISHLNKNGHLRFMNQAEKFILTL